MSIKMSPATIVQGFLILITFIGTAMCFPTGYPLVVGGNMINLWVIPTCLFAIALLIEKHLSAYHSFPTWMLVILYSISGGIWMGLSFGSILILNEWYADPDSGRWEPLLVATGLCSAGVLVVQRYFIRLRAKLLENE